MKPRSPRDHGYGNKPEVVGVPEVGESLDAPCPHCGCKKTFMIKVEIKNAPPQLSRPSIPHRIVGRYVGCAACAWASPMLTTTEPLIEKP